MTVAKMRNSLNYVSWKMRAEVAADLKSIYTSATADEASAAWVGLTLRHATH